MLSITMIYIWDLLVHHTYINDDWNFFHSSFPLAFDGSITIFYFATELASCMFTSVYPEIYMHRKIPFQKRLSWNFYQPSGTGIDLGFFEMDNL